MVEFEPIVLSISISEIETMDTTKAMTLLKKLIESPSTARAYIERLDIAFHGFDNTKQELFEICEVRNFVYELDKQFPYWLYFLSKRHLGLQCLLYCFLPTNLTNEARSRIHPERTRQLLTNRWLPAMNHLCKLTGFSEKDIMNLTERAITYTTAGRFPLDSEGFA